MFITHTTLTVSLREYLLNPHVPLRERDKLAYEIAAQLRDFQQAKRQQVLNNIQRKEAQHAVNIS